MGRPILIVEDDVDIAEAIREIVRLEAPHHEPIVARDGHEGIRAAHHEPKPCLIFLDLHMPDMGGDEFLDAKSADDAIKDIPVVVMTATRQNRNGKDHVTRTIHKPFDLIAILEELDEHCQ